MVNEFEIKILKAMKRFENRRVRVTQSGIIESRFDIENLNYTLEEGILAVEDDNENYIDIDLDDIEKLYFESTENGYAQLVLVMGKDLEVEMQTKEDNVISIRDRILKEIEKSGILEQLFEKEACGA